MSGLFIHITVIKEVKTGGQRDTDVDNQEKETKGQNYNSYFNNYCYYYYRTTLSQELNTQKT